MQEAVFGTNHERRAAIVSSRIHVNLVQGLGFMLQGLGFMVEGTSWHQYHRHNPLAQHLVQLLVHHLVQPLVHHLVHLDNAPCAGMVQKKRV